MVWHPMWLDELEGRNHVCPTHIPFSTLLTHPQSITFASSIKMAVTCGHATIANTSFAQGVSLFPMLTLRLCLNLMSSLSASATTGSSLGAPRHRHDIG